MSNSIRSRSILNQHMRIVFLTLKIIYIYIHCFSSLLQLAVGTIDGSHGQETWLGEILDVMSHDFGFYEGFLSDLFLFFPFF